MENFKNSSTFLKIKHTHKENWINIIVTGVREQRKGLNGVKK